MSKIPQAREELVMIEHQLSALLVRIEAARRLLDRRKSTYRAYGTRATFTPVLALKIRAFAQMNPSWTQQRIAEKFNVTNGRVSEALHGKHK